MFVFLVAVLGTPVVWELPVYDGGEVLNNNDSAINPTAKYYYNDPLNELFDYPELDKIPNYKGAAKCSDGTVYFAPHGIETNDWIRVRDGVAEVYTANISQPVSQNLASIGAAINNPRDDGYYDYTAGNGARFSGAIHHPPTDRIYLVPHWLKTELWYIDCATHTFIGVNIQAETGVVNDIVYSGGAHGIGLTHMGIMFAPYLVGNDAQHMIFLQAWQTAQGTNGIMLTSAAFDDDNFQKDKFTTGRQFDGAVYHAEAQKVIFIPAEGRRKGELLKANFLNYVNQPFSFDEEAIPANPYHLLPYRDGVYLPPDADRSNSGSHNSESRIIMAPNVLSRPLRFGPLNRRTRTGRECTVHFILRHSLAWRNSKVIFINSAGGPELSSPYKLIPNFELLQAYYRHSTSCQDSDGDFVESCTNCTEHFRIDRYDLPTAVSAAFAYEGQAVFLPISFSPKPFLYMYTKNLDVTVQDVRVQASIIETDPTARYRRFGGGVWADNIYYLAPGFGRPAALTFDSTVADAKLAEGFFL